MTKHVAFDTKYVTTHMCMHGSGMFIMLDLNFDHQRVGGLRFGLFVVSCCFLTQEM